jgi:hypothetical protein
MKYVKIVLAFYFLISSINRLISEEDFTFILAESNSYLLIKWILILTEILIAVSILTGSRANLGVILGFVLITPILILSLINTILGSDLNCQIGYLEVSPPFLLFQNVIIFALLMLYAINFRKKKPDLY